MAKKADTDKAAKTAHEAAMSKIEQQAQKQYAKDKAAADAALEAMNGKWTWEADSNYYYNALHRWYYDPKTQWYYGGQPVTWTQTPSLPAGAMFGTAPHEGGPVAQGAAKASTSGREGSAAGASTSQAQGAAASGVTTTVKRTIIVPQHPLASIGGYQAPTTGRVGGAKGAGYIGEAPEPAAVPTSGGGDTKRKREEPGAAAAGKGGSAKAVSAEEAEAQARREAARARVAARTAAGFGYV